MRKGKPGRRRTSTNPNQLAKVARYWRKVAAKICTSCSMPAKIGRVCERHAGSTAAYQAARTEALMSIGTCRECPWPATRGARCMTCRLKRSLRPSRLPEYRKKHEYMKARAA